MHRQITWSPGVTLEAIERQVIERALQHFGGNKSATASALGITARTIDNKIDKYTDDDKVARGKHDERRRRDQEFLARARGLATAPSPAPHNPQADERVYAEPAAAARAEQAVSVQEPEEVQGLLPPKAAVGGKRGRR